MNASICALRIAIFSSSALLLAACGGETIAEDSTDAKVVAAAAKAIAGGMGVSLSDLPDFAEVPSGTKPIHNMAINDGQKTGGSMSFETSQTPADLIAFYRASMARNGLKIEMETQSPQMVQMAAKSEDESKSLMVMINVDDEGKASLNLVHSRTKG